MNWTLGFLWGCLTSSALLITSSKAAGPPCQSGIGGTVFSTGQDVEVKIIPGNVGAVYTSDLYLDTGAGTAYCGNSKEYGRITTISNLAAGVELKFFIYVRNSGYYYYIGEASRNPDNLAHANVVCGTNDSAVIGFE